MFLNNLDCLEWLKQIYGIQQFMGKRDEIQMLTAEEKECAVKEK
jgi:hypothetical protein